MDVIRINAGFSVRKIKKGWRRGRFLIHLSVRNLWTNNKHLKNAIVSSSILDDTSPRAFMVAAVLHFVVLLSSRVSGELEHGPLKWKCLLVEEPKVLIVSSGNCFLL